MVSKSAQSTLKRLEHVKSNEAGFQLRESSDAFDRGQEQSTQAGKLTSERMIKNQTSLLLFLTGPTHEIVNLMKSSLFVCIVYPKKLVPS